MTTETATAQPGRDLQKLFEATPGIVLDDRSTFDKLFALIKEETAKVPVDLTTKKGRDRVISAAAKVTSTRTAIKDAAKVKAAALRASVKAIGDAADIIDAELLTFQIATRKPVTDWEAAEVEREAAARKVMDYLSSEMLIRRGETALQVRGRIETLEAVVLDPTVLADRMDEAAKARDTAIANLKLIAADLEAAEAQAIEFERLRVAEATRVAEAAAAAAEVARVAKEASDREIENLRAENAKMAARIAQQPAAPAPIVYVSDQGTPMELPKTIVTSGGGWAGTPIAPGILARAAANDATRAPVNAVINSDVAIVAGAEHPGVTAMAERRHLIGEAAHDIAELGLCDEETARAIVRAIADDEVRHLELRLVG